MRAPVEVRVASHKQVAQLTNKEQWQTAIGLGAIACGILLASGFAVYFLGADSTINAAVGILTFGAVVSLGVVVCFRIFGRPR
jgi:TRAP-type C4-dicarboxylate transport system permease small subunit